MNNIKFLSILFLFLLLVGCYATTGEIRQTRFYHKGYFSVDLLDDDWEVVRQKKSIDIPSYTSSIYEIAFIHKKSNGQIGVNSLILNEVDQARSLKVHAEDAVSRWSGMKLSQKLIKLDGIDAIELVISGKYMLKYIFLKKDNKGYEIIYRNTPTYFDEYLEVFDKFVKSFKLL